MTRDEHLFTIAAEECAELAQRLSKALRFGMYEVQPGQPLHNLDRIVGEYADLIAVMEMLAIYVAPDLGVAIAGEVTREAIAAKKLKVAKYLEYSHECGTVTP